MNMCRQLSFHYTDFIFSGTEYTPNRETAGWYSSSNSSLLKSPRTVFHKGCMTESLWAAPLCTLTVCCCPIFLATAVWTDMRWYLSTVLTCIAPLVGALGSVLIWQMYSGLIFPNLQTLRKISPSFQGFHWDTRDKVYINQWSMERTMSVPMEMLKGHFRSFYPCLQNHPLRVKVERKDNTNRAGTKGNVSSLRC